MELAIRRPSNSAFILFVILNFFDALFTSILIATDGFEIEVNPVIHWLLATFNTTLILWLWKIILLSFIAYVGKLTIGTKFEPRWRRIMIGANVLMISVVVWGIYNII